MHSLALLPKHSLPTLEALESTRRKNWTSGFYENRHGVRGVSGSGFRSPDSFTKFPFTTAQVPEPNELVEVISGVERLDPDRTWIYKTRRGIPGFLTTAWSNVPFQGSASRAVMISRSHEFTQRH